MAQKQQEAKVKLEKKRDEAHVKRLSELHKAGPQCNYLLDMEIDGHVLDIGLS